MAEGESPPLWSRQRTELDTRLVLERADPRVLAAVTVHLSQDPDKILPGTEKEKIIEIAAEVIQGYSYDEMIPLADDEVLQSAVNHAAGEPVPTEYLPLAREILGFDGSQTGDGALAPDGFRVLVVGAGVTGIRAAIALKEAGVRDVIVVERSDRPGGVWQQNTYPGCRVDTPSLLYGFISEADFPWPNHFSYQPAILEYLQHVIDKHDIMPQIRCRTAVQSLTWLDDDGVWLVELRTAKGRERIKVNFVIGATGLLRIPKVPEIDGLESFTGEKFHSSEWRHDIDLADTRVGVIGTGASANQIVPAIAGHVQHLTVFQRSAQWMIDHPQYGRPILGDERTLIESVPAYRQWYRFSQFWIFGDRVFDMLRVDPTWDGLPRSVNAVNARFARTWNNRLSVSLPATCG